VNNPLRPEHFAREDDGDDALFYDFARLVTHIDDDAIAALSAHYARTIPANADVLDLMSSWVSHLPADLALGSVTGLGMNAEELAANPRLTARLGAGEGGATSVTLTAAAIHVAVTSGPAAIPRLVELAQAEGVELLRVRFQGASLEDAFVAFTGREYAAK